MAGGKGDVVDQTGVTGTNDGKNGKTGGKNGKKGWSKTSFLCPSSTNRRSF